MSPDLTLALIIGILQILLALLALWQNHVLRYPIAHGKSGPFEADFEI
jgi:hypothetical protein